MLRVFHKALLTIFYGKESDTMLAMLWTQRIVNGKKTYDQVPRLLKEQVKELLIESGCEDLITETPASK